VDEIGIPITVCHYPPGTSKWNRIEHRVFSFISLTWQGQPLWNLETVINLIGATRTRSGLRVKAVLDTKRHQTGVKISAEQIEKLRIRCHKIHPAWNYTLLSRTA
jgi:Rhodopirellula transposase DDE domain